MNKKQTLAAALALSLLGIACASPSAWSATAPTPATKAARVAALFGSPADVSTTTRTVTLVPGMNYVNVASGETVAFRAGDKTVGWTFLEAVGGTSVDMRTIFPEMAQAKGIRVYIAPSQLFTGG
ncbi:CzcE family metal-binding protein [Cupriavidus basilensis]|uniref:CzcE family metal-binding protein n=1 Tax=Cupriavidus basilensis TaxID=68895 RepID=UPI00284DF949|nr:CzcE family metal-binding protein [Cupriavidus basilensis]MDR3379904.1 CzcE family metal-binding protein [Cupriavidus basilensis]